MHTQRKHVQASRSGAALVNAGGVRPVLGLEAHLDYFSLQFVPTPIESACPSPQYHLLVMCMQNMTGARELEAVNETAAVFRNWILAGARAYVICLLASGFFCVLKRVFLCLCAVLFHGVRHSRLAAPCNCRRGYVVLHILKSACMRSKAWLVAHVSLQFACGCSVLFALTVALYLAEKP